MGNIYPREKGGNVKPTKWIQGAIKRPGQLHRDLGVPQGQKIPSSTLAAAAKREGAVGQRARLAQTLSHMQRKSTKGSPMFTDKEIMQGYRKL
jgi:hypothetical protein